MGKVKWGVLGTANGSYDELLDYMLTFHISAVMIYWLLKIFIKKG